MIENPIHNSSSKENLGFIDTGDFIVNVIVWVSQGRMISRFGYTEYLSGAVDFI